MSFKVMYIKTGWHKARIKDIAEVDTKFGKANKVTFLLEEGPEISALFPYKVSPRNKSMKLLRALNLPLERETEIRDEELLGKEVKIYISVDERGLSRIIDFAPVI